MPAVNTVSATLVAPPPDGQALVAWLLRPDSYPERPARVGLIETHISWVFLTDRYAYKLKKPVRFDFLDFSTAELRREACNQELSLNRRLASSVYLNVVPITVDPRGQRKLDGHGLVVDWLVKMRRLPGERALHRLHRRGLLTEADVESLAVCLAKFYERQPPLSIGVEAYRRALTSHVMSNWEAWRARPGVREAAIVERVHERQVRWLRLACDQFDHRVLDGRLVEGHGDLRPEHIYLDRHPLIIDCIEFNPEYRRIDVLDELGSLAMECDLLGAAWVGRRILAQYYRLSGDRAPAPLLAFYKCYRACVRAKVMLLRGDQLPEARREALRGESAAYLKLADEYARTLGPATAIVVRGLPGSGKSTLARQLAEALHLPLLQTDALRRERFGPSAVPRGFGEAHYGLEQRTAIYEEMFSHADTYLSAGRSVLLDGTFLAAAWRTTLRELAQRRGVELIDIRCCCRDELALQRIADRLRAGGGLSEARVDFYWQQKRSEEPAASDEDTIATDTSASPPETLQFALAALRDRILPPILAT